jgi:L-fuculose-phosphate aldolase
MTEPTSTPHQEMIAEIVRRVLERYIAVPQTGDDPHELFSSPRAQELKEEIVAAGKKLWQRHYVDGNAGNISARLSPDYFICTPTMVSKGDLRVEDLSLVDLDNRQIIGTRPQTSEIRLHLAIYREVPQAKAVIHCHAPYATAHAVAHVVPQGNLVPEQEVFIGPVVLAPYETPGTQAFAETVVPMVRRHNTILLANHGIVCWADTVTHAEWYTEVIETYCKTVMIASQLRSPLPEIPQGKILELLEFKKGLGLPDPRLPEREAPGRGDQGQHQPANVSARPRLDSTKELEQLATAVTSEVLRYLNSRS